jgi:hypothetical protein
MINPHIKNQRTGVHLDIQNRSSHYLKLINTKPCVDNSWGRDQKALSSLQKMRKSLELPSSDQNKANKERKSQRNLT